MGDMDKLAQAYKDGEASSNFEGAVSQTIAVAFHKTMRVKELTLGDVRSALRCDDREISSFLIEAVYENLHTKIGNWLIDDMEERAKLLKG